MDVFYRLINVMGDDLTASSVIAFGDDTYTRCTSIGINADKETSFLIVIDNTFVFVDLKK